MLAHYTKNYTKEGIGNYLGPYSTAADTHKDTASATNAAIKRAPRLRAWDCTPPLSLMFAPSYGDVCGVHPVSLQHKPPNLERRRLFVVLVHLRMCTTRCGLRSFVGQVKAPKKLNCSSVPVWSSNRVRQRPFIGALIPHLLLQHQLPNFQILDPAPTARDLAMLQYTLFPTHYCKP